MEPLITCKELIDFLADYVEGELPAAPRTEFDRHLAICPSCIHYVETYKATILLSREALCDPAGAPPPDVPEELIAAILAAKKKARE